MSHLLSDRCSFLLILLVLSVLFSVLWKKMTLGRPDQRRIWFPKVEPCSGQEHFAGLEMEPMQPDEQMVQKLVKMGFAEVDVRIALQDCRGDEIWAIEKLRLGQQVQKLVKMGFAEVDVRNALYVSDDDETMAIKVLRLAECAWGGNVTYTKLWQPGEQQVRKYKEMGFTEAAVRCAFEAGNGSEIFAIKMLCLAKCGPAGINTHRELWRSDEQWVQELVEMDDVYRLCIATLIDEATQLQSTIQEA